nr:MAG TPA: hypothetical protein [Caudoviricetes sp.]
MDLCFRSMIQVHVFLNTEVRPLYSTPSDTNLQHP